MHSFNGNVFDEQEFENLDCSGQDLTDFIFRDCSFVACNFADAKLSKSQWSDCELRDCNFSNARLYDARFSDVAFNSCKLAGIDFTTCNQLLFSISLSNSSAPYCIFQGMDLTGCRLTDSELLDCVFEGTTLKRVDFRNSNLKGADFVRADLSQADLRGATGYRIDPAESRVTKARFSYPEVLVLLDSFGVVVE